jgi:hypothetical protein
VGLLSPVVAAAKAPQIARGLLQAGENAAAPRTLGTQTGTVVWHGSPHKFDKFDSSKIGTGEGAQAYGHGLYLADDPKVAGSYKDQLAGWKVPEGWSDKYPETARGYIRAMVGDVATGRETPEHAAKAIGYANANMRGYDAKQLAKELAEAADYAKGSLYKVDLPDEHIAKMLDWDKPLSQQAPEVREAMKNLVGKDALGRPTRSTLNEDQAGRWAYETLQRDRSQNLASKALQQQGIPGIRYLDGGSRGAGQGTSNYVVFPGNEGLLNILERNGQALR